MNGSIEVFVDGSSTPMQIPEATRSLKLVNINSAASGIFFWGHGRSSKHELQRWTPPRLNDGKMEVMATKGSTDLAMAKTHMAHAHRLAQCERVELRVLRPPVFLQIDGEGWRLDRKCSLHVDLKDQVPTLVGYKHARGVRRAWTDDGYNERIKRHRHAFRDTVRKQFKVQQGKKHRSISMDDFHIGHRLKRKKVSAHVKQRRRWTGF